MKTALVRVMAIGLDDFLRLLPHLVELPAPPPTPCNSIALPAQGITLCWQVLPVVRSGAMRLPQLEVTLLFDDMQSAGSIAFLRRFDYIFQRGGG
ncbi:MAG: hypothetical protein N2Z69_08440 [Methylophilaceae bacterium]|nr:hypothetical protein [Methylophilaceae bacterium]